jgi:hypothetical protein
MLSSTQKKLCGVAAVALLCLAPSALADSNTLTMTGAGNNVMQGVYVGPYYATVNGVVNTPVICDDFADDSVIGHSWSFTPNNFSTLGSALWGNQTQNYESAAWLTLQMLSLNSIPGNSTQVGYLSYAIWSLFDQAALGKLNTTQLAGVSYWKSMIPSNLTTSEFANFVILTPKGCAPGTCPGQEFFMLVPEGGSTAIYLLVAGLACFGAIIFRPGRQVRAAVSRIA